MLIHRPARSIRFSRTIVPRSPRPPIMSLLFMELLMGLGIALLSGGTASGQMHQAVTAFPDSSVSDSTHDVVKYWGDRVEYSPASEQMVLLGNVRAAYGSIEVTADTVIFDMKENRLLASGSPVLAEGEEKITGTTMGYDLDTERGYIMSGRTKIEKGWFDGVLIRKVGSRALNVTDGQFTTCDEVAPHYYFWSKRMKVYADDMVVCEPLVLVAGGTPVFAVPFWFFPIKKGRRSGFLIPRVGRKEPDEGKYVKNVAYYLVINDYSDVTFTLDYMERRGPRLAFEGIYLVAPYVSGSLIASFIEEMGTGSRRWRVDGNHRHQLGDRTTLVARADFSSDERYLYDYSDERLLQLHRELNSYLSITRSWSGASATFVAEEKVDLDQELTSRILPKIRLGIQKRPFVPLREGTDTQWFNSLYWSYHSLAINSMSERDTTREEHWGWDNNLGLSSTLKPLQYVNMSSSVNLKETVYDRDRIGHRWAHREAWDASVGMSTTLYGVSDFTVGPVEAWRHVLRPSITYGYAPDIKQDDFYTFGGIGSVSSVNGLSFSISNDFQAKVRSGEELKKLDLASLVISSGYNFKVDEHRLANVTEALDISPARLFQIRFTGVHDPYKMRMVSLSATGRITVSSDGRTQGAKIAPNGGEGEEAVRRGWEATLSNTYTKRRNPDYTGHQVWGTVSFWPTNHWKLTYSTRYDVSEGRLIDQQLGLYRDLHCWEATFSWETYGDRWQYDFRIQIKALPEIKLGKGLFGLILP
jgi:lipopolysaccharide assembly outer membrane protein LptD (OstA)